MIFHHFTLLINLREKYLRLSASVSEQCRRLYSFSVFVNIPFENTVACMLFATRKSYLLTCGKHNNYNLAWNFDSFMSKQNHNRPGSRLWSDYFPRLYNFCLCVWPNSSADSKRILFMAFLSPPSYV